MSFITILRGLPSSGKSTWSKEQVAAHPGQTKRWSKDDIRAMLDLGKWSKHNEKFVLELRDAAIRLALSTNTNLLIDDCNLPPTHEERIRHIVSEFNKLEGKQHRVLIKGFTDVPVEECIQRDLKRERSVGEKVIRDMYNRHLAPKIETPTYDPTLPNACIVDMDGTLALLNGRDPYNASTCDQDLLNESVASVVRVLADAGRRIIIVSGRPVIHEEPTISFLEKHVIPWNHLFMRRADDRRQDVEVKRDIYNEHIKGKYNVVAVFDDRLQVCRLWWDLGLPLYRVGSPDADF